LQNHDKRDGRFGYIGHMNAKPIATVLAGLVSASLITAAAADGKGLVERGLLEEEANHQLDAAIRNYQEALAYLGTNRQMLATALFRLGECYRKEGKVNEAKMQYRRVLRDFPEQTELARLSQEVVGNATNPPPAYVLSFGTSSADPKANLSFPGGIAVDALGNVYVSDTHHNRIQKFTARGEFLSAWGNGGTNAGCLDYPQGLAVDGPGNVYVADTHNHRVQKFTPEGGFITQWGKLGTNSGEFNSPYSIAVDPAGDLYVADAHNDRIQKFASDGTYLAAFGGSGMEPGKFDLPKSVAVDRAGNVYVADTGNKRIQQFSAEGVYLEDWGNYGKQPGQFDIPHDVAVDPWGNVYVADADGPDHNNRVQVFANDGGLEALWGSFGAGPGQFNFAARVAIDPSGLNIYVCDASNNRVQLFTFAGQ
jgi:DNA-binding beta-propeller fold protein YncE